MCSRGEMELYSKDPQELTTVHSVHWIEANGTRMRASLQKQAFLPAAPISYDFILAQSSWQEAAPGCWRWEPSESWKNMKNMWRILKTWYITLESHRPQKKYVRASKVIEFDISSHLQHMYKPVSVSKHTLLPGTPQPAASDLSLGRLGGTLLHLLQGTLLQGSTLLQQLLGRLVGGHVQTTLPRHWAASMAKPAVSQNLGVVSGEDHPNPPKKTKTKFEMNQNAIKCFNHGYHLTPPCNSTGVSVSMAEYHPRSWLRPPPIVGRLVVRHARSQQGPHSVGVPLLAAPARSVEWREAILKSQLVSWFDHVHVGQICDHSWREERWRTPVWLLCCWCVTKIAIHGSSSKLYKAPLCLKAMALPCCQSFHLLLAVWTWIQLDLTLCTCA